MAVPLVHYSPNQTYTQCANLLGLGPLLETNQAQTISTCLAHPDRADTTNEIIMPHSAVTKRVMSTLGRLMIRHRHRVVVPR